VFVQTCTPEHPAIAAAAMHDEAGWVASELEQRREAGYPPYLRLATVLFSGKDEAAIEALATRVADAIRGSEGADGIEVLGPAPQSHARLRGQHRWHVLLKGADSVRLREAARHALDAAEGLPGRSAIRIAVDVDPVDVL
jgi:primosomal protein N' (replication factor Y)